MRYYRVDKVASEMRSKIVYDEMLYIELKLDKIGRKCYYMVEDYGKEIFRYRIQKSTAEYRIEIGNFKEKN